MSDFGGLVSNLSGRRVLITGHNGFKGSWLSLWMHRLGVQVVGVSLAPEPDSLFVRASLEGVVRSEQLDIRNGVSDIRDVFEAYQPDLVIHMAAQPLVLDSYEDPYSTFETNVMGTVNVLEASRSIESVRGTITVTTDKVYRSHPLRAHEESDPLGGYDPYSLSKAACEMAVSAWRHSGVDRRAVHISVRAGNVIGGGDVSRNRLMPDLVSAFLVGKSATVRNPSAVRPWQHVLDPLYGYLLVANSILAEKPLPPAVNFGPASETELTVGEVADLAASAWGDGADWVALNDGQLAAPESPHLTIDSSLAQRELGWAPVWTQADAVERTMRWWREVTHGRDARRQMEKDIADFTTALDFRR